MEQTNMAIYSAVRSVPAEAKKAISGGRLNGKTDINPVWRIKIMTDTFGPCGVGWKYIITRQWAETYGNEVKAFCNIDLFIKSEGEWSDAIPGTGGAAMVEQGRSGAYVNDEAYKMALTDALSVAMKSLGVAADVYFAADAKYETKYEVPAQAQAKAVKTAPADPNALPDYVVNSIAASNGKEALLKVFNAYPEFQKNKQFLALLSSRKKELNIR